nr:probable purine permease 4 [Tanacetum cinerariifolium]
MLKKFGLEDSKPTKTPMSTEIKLTKDDETDSMDSSKYRGTKMPNEYQQDCKKTRAYALKIYNDPNMSNALRDIYKTLESRYVHEGRTIDPSFYNDLSDDSVAKFTAIGICIYSDAWGLDELEKTLEQIKPYNSRLLAIDDVRNLIHQRTIRKKDADNFNSFIKNYGLIDLHLGGRLFTWMNKAGTKLSKLDRFLISEELIEEKIEAGSANDDERNSHIKLLQEQKRRYQMIHGIMKEGVWISDPSQIKEEFLNFFKEKFKDHDSNVDFLPFANSSGLCALDRDSLETPVSLDEVKNVVWDCGSSKALGPDGVSFTFVKKYWDDIKVDILEYVIFFLILVHFLVDLILLSSLSFKSNSGCALGFFPFNYLGLPIGSNMSLTSSWQVLFKRFQSKLSSWKANPLSIEGLHTLIKDFLGSLCIYYFSVFKVHKSILNSLERSRAMFFESGVGGCFRTRMRSGLKLSKLYMVRKVALITMVASITGFGNDHHLDRAMVGLGFRGNPNRVNRARSTKGLQTLGFWSTMESTLVDFRSTCGDRPRVFEPLAFLPIAREKGRGDRENLCKRSSFRRKLGHGEEDMDVDRLEIAHSGLQDLYFHHSTHWECADKLMSWLTIVATIVMVIAGGFKKMKHENVALFDLRHTKYWSIVRFNVITWQLCFMGTTGMVFLTTLLTGGICMTALMAMNALAGVLVYGDNFKDPKVVSTLLCLWAFYSYVYEIDMVLKVANNGVDGNDNIDDDDKETTKEVIDRVE